MTDHFDSGNLAWKINVPGHAPRGDSPRYRHSALTLKKLVASAPPGMYGPGDAEDHHGGGLWLWSDDKPMTGIPFLVLNLAGIEWSAQFCAAPERVDLLRVNAALLYSRFPNSVAALESLGCEAYKLLWTPITDAAWVADWTDSIFNASVPYPKPVHTGQLPASGGVHHYPKPITDIEFFKRSDFTLWVNDADGVPIAVVPIAPPGSGISEVAVLYVPPHSRVHLSYAAARDRGELKVLPGDHPLAQAAFARQRQATPSNDA